MTDPAGNIARTPSLATTQAVAARLREAASSEFQAQHVVPAREGLVYQQPQPPIQFDQVAPVPQGIGGVGAPAPRELALMAADVYNDVASPPPGYRVANDADLARLGLRTQDLSSPQSSFRARVYVTGEGDAAGYVVSFRGTTDGSDWKANLRQGVGLPSDQYAHALLIAKALARNPDVNVTLTGHSLGGGLASAAALGSGRDAATFNAAGLSSATIQQAEQIRTAAGIGRAAEIAAFYVKGEVLSAVQDGGDRVVGAIFGGVIGGVLADAPEAYGARHPLDAVRPAGTHWYQDNPVARHGMDWVLSSLPAN
ncbi:DUF2974 domain-containing protein [Sphingomonas cannabina]|uniref:lipase family protein n=1 Tax=Sphingomonas cannabina TaxID=2899123 RepID=UPI001F30A191|nr:Mbeg1-like protein [Sphingomonas cannabina]UIJ46498.1 DUF2974 domain-containing protein [Sphingomonas cannabina]